MALVKRHELTDGEPWTVRQHFYISCCDCGLRHHVLFDVNGKELITLRIYRDQTGTEINRKGFKAPKFEARVPRKRQRDRKKAKRR